jgi:hypothetical protein
MAPSTRVLYDRHVVGLHRADAAHDQRHVLRLGDGRNHRHAVLGRGQRARRRAVRMLQEEVARSRETS